MPTDLRVREKAADWRFFSFLSTRLRSLGSLMAASCASNSGVNTYSSSIGGSGGSSPAVAQTEHACGLDARKQHEQQHDTRSRVVDWAVQHATPTGTSWGCESQTYGMQQSQCPMENKPKGT